MRLGRVIVDMSYVVDLDNEDMVQGAKTCLYEDLMSAYKYDELGNIFDTVEDNTVTQTDIPDFLLGSTDDEDND